ncbi:protein-L-isoaspartate O-methyltransferase family protein [Microvirga lotononidis]|uniref:Protein-L-isoaspartate O-methyltransferase n=1 Tax=Microvirga lotononidis TaxID=864069 RepID=I4YQM9_9HYPH|nr:methyltransferase domain-containing protein [Microvirga lotononidis]EIM26271.1 protein-L-isoaspartate carboxylmethyltransferase [Microvirga lotononidis]WQO30648.1 methyltransferase domain-containing protein [Microvirga lotononidis]
MTENELSIVRRAYAKQIMAADWPVVSQQVEDAFAAVPREHFLGPGPWPIFRFWQNGYMTTPSADPVYLYTNDLVGIAPERHINNGQPSLHAHLLACAAPNEGEHVVHVGAGLGYYSAIMAEMIGPSGQVTAIEYELDLAARARENLSRYANVSVIQGDGASVPFEPADVIYVNAGTTKPADIWLDRLRDGGRLILPLTTDKSFRSAEPGPISRRGAVFLITRRGPDFLARWVSPVAIYPCAGLRDEASEHALAAAFEKGDWKRVTGLRRTANLPEEQCWLRAQGWSLTYEEPVA